MEQFLQIDSKKFLMNLQTNEGPVRNQWESAESLRSSAGILTQSTKTPQPGGDGSSESCSISHEFHCVAQGARKRVKRQILFVSNSNIGTLTKI